MLVGDLPKLMEGSMKLHVSVLYMISPFDQVPCWLLPNYLYQDSFRAMNI